MLNEHINKLTSLIDALLEKNMGEDEFKEQFESAITSYRQYLERSHEHKRPYYPLNDLCQMSGDKLRKYAGEAYSRLPKELLARSTCSWVEENLTIEGEVFNFYNEGGDSLFGDSVKLYSTDIKESFFLSAMEGIIPASTFNYTELLSVLEEVGDSEPAAWVTCSEPDNAFALINHPCTLGKPYEETRHLAKLELTEPQSVQGGDCFLILLPENKEWMLLHYYNFSSVVISLHGSNEFIDTVLSHNKVINSDAAKLRRL